MNLRAPRAALLLAAVSTVFASGLLRAQTAPPQNDFGSDAIGYANFAAETRLETKFLAVPNPQRAGEELKTLTAEPHLAATPEDGKTAEYVASQFRADGFETQIVPDRVLLNWPIVQRVEARDAKGHLLLSGPTREHAAGDPAPDDPRVTMPFNGSSGSGDVTGEVVYANYGRREDFNELAARHIDVRGKIVLCRYGENFRGVKVYLAEQRGAAGVILYSDPRDDGFTRGETWPKGPWRPAAAVQGGSVQYLFKYPGDPETPGVASTLDLPDSARIAHPDGPGGNEPHIVSIPLSAHDAEPILRALQGPKTPASWQGGLPFSYRMGPGGVRVHLVSRQESKRRIIWNVIGKIPGADEPDESVIAGNHRDAWVYGAVDPSSGTAAMLEAARGLGALLRAGWRPRRTILFCSWDAEEQGLIGSTEWVEEQDRALDHAVAYFNVDIAVSGPDFSAAAVPSLKEFVRSVTRSVPSPLGGSVYQVWRNRNRTENSGQKSASSTVSKDEPPVGNLGSGSDYTPFLQHAGVPSTDIESSGPYGVYHSAFDDFAWFTTNADPHFLYLQQMARILGLEVLRMADADVLPYDYTAYARQIASQLEAARQRAAEAGLDALDFAPAQAAAARFLAEAQRVTPLESSPSGDPERLNLALRKVETSLLTEAGLPGRPWYKHTIFAPGEATGYAAVVLPGVNEAIDAQNRNLAVQQLEALAAALNRATHVLQSVR